MRPPIIEPIGQGLELFLPNGYAHLCRLLVRSQASLLDMGSLRQTRAYSNIFFLGKGGCQILDRLEDLKPALQIYTPGSTASCRSKRMLYPAEF